MNSAVARKLLVSRHRRSFWAATTSYVALFLLGRYLLWIPAYRGWVVPIFVACLVFYWGSRAAATSVHAAIALADNPGLAYWLRPTGVRLAYFGWEQAYIYLCDGRQIEVILSARDMRDLVAYLNTKNPRVVITDFYDVRPAGEDGAVRECSGDIMSGPPVYKSREESQDQAAMHYASSTASHTKCSTHFDIYVHDNFVRYYRSRRLVWRIAKDVAIVTAALPIAANSAFNIEGLGPLAATSLIAAVVFHLYMSDAALNAHTAEQTSRNPQFIYWAQVRVALVSRLPWLFRDLAILRLYARNGGRFERRLHVFEIRSFLCTIREAVPSLHVGGHYDRK